MVDLVRIKSRGWVIALRVGVWFGAAVVLGLLPLLFPWAQMVLSGHKAVLAVFAGHGELYIAGAVLAGGALGELMAAPGFSADRTRSRLIRFIFGFCALLLLVANVAGFTTHGDPATIAGVSWRVFIVTVVFSGAIIGMVAS